jgi:ELWxxDGT repeat protein
MSDGTTGGTMLLKDINPGSGSSYGDLFTMFNNKLYFQANDGTNGYELWVTDGTAGGTMLLKDINVGVGDSYPGYFTALGSKLYFRGASDLWVTNGTTIGTYSLAPASSNSDGLGCTAAICAFGSSIYFNADYDVNNCEVWKLDTAGSVGITPYTQNIYQVMMYPNPSNGVFNLQISGHQNMQVEIYNTLGQLMLTQNIENNLTQLNMMNFNNGIYNVRLLKNNELIYQKKVIKE